MTPHCSRCRRSLLGTAIDPDRCVTCPGCGATHWLTPAQAERLQAHQQPALPGLTVGR